MGLFELIYYIGYKVKTSYDVSRRKRLPVRVVSIGNLTTGGTGKTPATIALALEAKRRGLSPCVLTRGYKGKLRGPRVVTPQMNPLDVGDEPLLMACHLESIPVIKGKDRHASGLYALRRNLTPPALFIMDDGFQHRKLHRDLDILLVNAQDPFDNGRLLPMGHLREPLSQMRRADIIVLTKSTGEDTTETVEVIRRYNTTAPIFRAAHRPTFLCTVNGQRLAVDEISGRSVMAFCGIAEPDAFRRTLEELGTVIRDFRAFGDHHLYTAQDIEDLARVSAREGADWLITTEKDIMRLAGTGEKLPLDLVSLSIEFQPEEAFYRQVFEQAAGGEGE